MFILSAVVCVFALYGLFTALRCAAACLRDTGPSRAVGESVVMFVKNQAEEIEGIVRSAAWRALARSGGRTVEDIVAVDLGSEDETFEILMRLQNEYEFVHAMNRENYIEKVQEM